MISSKRFLIISLSIIFLSSALIKPALAARQLEVQIPGLTTTTLPALPDYIVAIFNFALMIVGIVCLGVLIFGGFLYLTSAGNPSAMTDAKDRIFSALLGLIILFSAWLILTTINPQLVILTPIPGGGCHSNAECDSGYTCQVGICTRKLFQMLACDSATPCPADQQCIAKFCTQQSVGWSSESCFSYNTEGDCEKNINPATGFPYCDWCPRCSGINVNTLNVDACIKYGEVCSYSCVVGQCGAPDPCPS